MAVFGLKRWVPCFVCESVAIRCENAKSFRNYLHQKTEFSVWNLGVNNNNKSYTNAEIQKCAKALSEVMTFYGTAVASDKLKAQHIQTHFAQYSIPS